MSEVRSSELKAGLSSSDDPVKAEMDIAASGPSSSVQREIRHFYALKEECALDVNTLFRFRYNFNSLRKSGFDFLVKEKKPVLPRLEKYVFIRLLSNAALGFPSIHLS